MYHYKKKHKRYMVQLKREGCPFCADTITQDLVEETPHSWVVPNKPGYDLWETHDVIDHLMIIPKRHVLSLHEMTDAEKQDTMQLLAAYEAKGYNIYARTTANTRKSVPHQHTHLIKIAPERARLFIASKKPYFVVKF